MAVNLQKGQGISLRKDTYDLSQVTIGLGWDIAEESLGEQKLEDYDLDVVAFLCGSDGKIRDLGRIENGHPTLDNGDVVFYNNMHHHSGQIWLTGDNRTGAGEGDDEQIIVNLNNLPERYAKVVFAVQIYQGLKKRQSFGRVKNAFIRAVDRRNREMVRFDLSGGAAYNECRSMLFAEMTREPSGWKFNAIGTPFASDSFVAILKRYL